MLLTPGAACWYLHKQSKQIAGLVPHFKSKSMATGRRDGTAVGDCHRKVLAVAVCLVFSVQ